MDGVPLKTKMSANTTVAMPLGKQPANLSRMRGTWAMQISPQFSRNALQALARAYVLPNHEIYQTKSRPPSHLLSKSYKCTAKTAKRFPLRRNLLKNDVPTVNSIIKLPGSSSALLTIYITPQLNSRLGYRPRPFHSEKTLRR
jgi:hypothetical protein